MEVIKQRVGMRSRTRSNGRIDPFRPEGGGEDEVEDDDDDDMIGERSRTAGSRCVSCRGISSLDSISMRVIDCVGRWWSSQGGLV